MSYDLDTLEIPRLSPLQVRRILRRSTPRKKIGRNEPCPCASGKKFKHCHGAPRPVVPSGRYICEHDDPNVQCPRGEVTVIQDERGFPTIQIADQKRWPLHMLPEGCRLRPISNEKGQP